MNACKDFSKKYPVILAVLAFGFLFGLLKLMGFMPDGPLSFGIIECVLAALVFPVVFIFMGKEKMSISAKGFRYSFGLLRGYYIFMVCLTALGVFFNILKSVVMKTDFPYQLIPFINILLVGIFVGIVEEGIFRSLIFGGLVQRFGNSKKSIIIAALISGFSFGALHVIGPVLHGEVTDVGSVTTAILKIVQCAIFGIILCFIYYKTRNFYVIAALHSLDDFMLFVTAGAGSTSAADYVATESSTVLQAIGAYVVFTLILVPALVRSIKDIKAGEAIPFDDDFLPREVEFEKKSKR